MVNWHRERERGDVGILMAPKRVCLFLQVATELGVNAMDWLWSWRSTYGNSKRERGLTAV
jgi:hypothetical protein